MELKLKMPVLLVRETAISDLIDNEIKTIVNDAESSDNSYINDIFRIGFKGYDNFTNEELASEYKEQLCPNSEDEIIVVDDKTE